MSAAAVCPRCLWVGHPTIVHGRFRVGGSIGYLGAFDGAPIRDTREEAERDVCDQQRARGTGGAP